MLQELLSKKEGGSSLAPNPSATSDGCQYWSNKTRRIKKLQFGIVNPNELRESSVTQAITINNRRIPDGIHRYKTVINGERVYGGANDPRLGNLDDKNNPGFFGHINLAKPVYHPGFFNVMLKVLRCICFYCCRLRMDESEFKFQKTRAIRYVRDRWSCLYVIINNSSIICMLTFLNAHYI
jgi:DNA-directed RNA polymerase II subunit RPB1